MEISENIRQPRMMYQRTLLLSEKTDTKMSMCKYRPSTKIHE